MKTLLFITVLIGVTSFSSAQRTDLNWYFGSKAGISFASGQPIAITDGQLEADDNSSTITDNEGNLLFYTNGMKVWNKNHVVMSNGIGLLSTISGGQSAIIIPSNYLSEYYIFTVDAIGGSNGLRYSKVDLTLNDGLGAVTEKNTLLISRCTEKLAAIQNPNDGSYWLVAHGWSDNNYYSYKIGTGGLENNPVISSIGQVHSGGSPNGYNAMGQMTISPDGTKIASGLYSTGTIEIFDFDISSGVLSNPIIINNFSSAWGIAFSPNGKLLYATKWFGKDIYQFDLTIYEAQSIETSRTIVGTVTGPGTGNYYVGYLQIAPDDRIYAAKFDDTYLAVLSNPDVVGIGCSFIDEGFYLGGKLCRAGLSRSATLFCSKGGDFRTPPGNQPCPTAFEDINALYILPYPNPASEILYMPTNGWKANDGAQIEIFDVLGRKVYESSYRTIQDSDLAIDVSHLADGLYVVSIQMKNLQNRFRVQIK